MPSGLAWRADKPGSPPKTGSQGRAQPPDRVPPESDLGPDAGRIANRNRDLESRSCIPCHSHGISEAWITSGTPSLPTERMARSTSFNPNLCVVISSSGKRFDAICSSASSQAL